MNSRSSPDWCEALRAHFTPVSLLVCGQVYGEAAAAAADGCPISLPVFPQQSVSVSAASCWSPIDATIVQSVISMTLCLWAYKEKTWFTDEGRQGKIQLHWLVSLLFLQMHPEDGSPLPLVCSDTQTVSLLCPCNDKISCSLQCSGNMKPSFTVTFKSAGLVSTSHMKHSLFTAQRFTR